MPVEDGGQESSGGSWGEAMARTRWVVGHATSMPLDACESPAQACARSVECDELYRINEATMQGIVNQERMATRYFAIVAKMSLVNTSRPAQRFNVLKDPLVKIVASAVALPIVEGHALGNIQMRLIANFDVHRQYALLRS